MDELDGLLNEWFKEHPDVDHVDEEGLLILWMKFLKEKGYRIVKLRERGSYWTEERQWSSAPTFSIEEEL